MSFDFCNNKRLYKENQQKFKLLGFLRHFVRRFQLRIVQHPFSLISLSHRKHTFVQ